MLEPELFASFYGHGDELNLAFNFMLLHSEFEATQLRARSRTSERLLPDDCWPVWTGGNHDINRFASALGRWRRAQGAHRAVHAAVAARDAVPLLRRRDRHDQHRRAEGPAARPGSGSFTAAASGGDPERTPMPWTRRAGWRVHRTGCRALASFRRPPAANVAAQRHDPLSMLALARDLVSFRDAIPDLARGDYRTDPRSNDERWIFRRGGADVRRAQHVGRRDDALLGARAACASQPTSRATGCASRASSVLAPWESVIVWLDQEVGAAADATTAETGSATSAPSA